METVVMVIGEKMFSGAQEGGKGGEGTVEMYGERGIGTCPGSLK